MWFAIIMVVAGILAAVLGWGGGAIHFIETYFSYRDDSYRPMDTERHAVLGTQDPNRPTEPSRPPGP
jgi:hypothetical protein